MTNLYYKATSTDSKLKLFISYMKTIRNGFNLFRQQIMIF